MNLETLFDDALRHYQMGALRDAERLCDRIIRKRPDHFPSLYLLACVELQQGKLKDGIRHIKASLRLQPDHVDALFNLACALTLISDHGEALKVYARLLAISPEHFGALENSGGIHVKLGRYEEALAYFKQALSIRPDAVEALANSAVTLIYLNRHDEALALYEKALMLRPNDAAILYAQGSLLEELNRTADATRAYEKALAIQPDFAKARFALCTSQLPVLYVDEQEIATRRAAYAQRLETLVAEVAKQGASNLADGFGPKQPFFLPYQEKNDRSLQQAYGNLVCGVFADRYPAPYPSRPPGSQSGPRKPLKVGVVSGFFRNHSNWKIPIKGWIGNLDRNRFRVFGYHTAQSEDEDTRLAAKTCERFVQGGLTIEDWRKAIAGDAPDILIYPEIGMDPVAAQLAAQRLAPVQCNSWGHPMTSGFPTLDYFLSSDLMEPDQGSDHYTERLVRLPNLGIYYEPPATSVAAGEPTDLRLRPGAIAFWCGQSVQKYLPQYDQVFPRIAAQMDDAQFVFIASPIAARVTELFRARLAKAFSAHGLDAEQHCVFLPRMDSRKFAASMARCDIFLDSIGWSGCNSTLESMVHNLPVVTLPGALMRGRHSMAILTMMGVTETIARSVEDYIDIAVRLGRDAPQRISLQTRISDNKHKLYRDQECIAGLERFLETAARAP